MPTIFFRITNVSGLFILLFLAVQLKADAQKKESFYNDSLFTRYAKTGTSQYDSNSIYYVTRWTNTPPAGVQIVRQLDRNTAIISIGNKQQFDFLQIANIVVPAKQEWKLSPAAERLVQRNPRAIQKIIIAASNIDRLRQLMKELSSVKVLAVNLPSRALVIECSTNVIRDLLLGIAEITFIDIATFAHAETGVIGYDRTFHGISAIDYQIPDADGKNIVAGVKEQQMDAADIDLYNRILSSPVAAPATSYHANVIASIIGGAGNSFYDARGVANACSFFPSTFANLFADDAALLTEKKVSVQNHSYGTVIQQFYGAEALSYDDLIWKHQNIVPVFSAGNQGDAAALEGPYKNFPGYANLTGNFKMAKNIITVGAVDNNETLAAESSSGPLYDGRVAPQLVALGPNGTSDASAVVSGTIAVMQQVYADSNSQSIPPSSLIKAILYNTADEIYTPGIDYKTGYGMLNSYAAVRAVQQKKFDAGSVIQNETWTTDITVPASTASLKITLAWADSAAAVNNYKALINDLDLQVTELSNGTIYLPWVLNSIANKDSLAAAPLRKRDSLNTAEQVSIALPAAGVYRVKITGVAIAGTSIPFNIAYSTDTLNKFRFTSPLHASDIALAANGLSSVRWKTFTTDSDETGKLYVSYNSGNNWQLLEADLKLNTQKYQWAVKDTNTAAQLKMETGFGNFLSNQFMIARLTKPVVDFVCADSFRLSWNRHVHAIGYNIYTLTENPDLQSVLTVTDSFIVLSRQQYPSKVYAVQPLLNNGLPAARSAAIDIDQQGVRCFYRALNYVLEDNNRLKLLLELSVTVYVDSVVFEKVTPSGQLLQTYGGSKVNGSQFIYSLFADDIMTGVTNLRGRIRLKSGVMIYTNIIPVLTSGKNNIVFYPNPGLIKNRLHYVLKQGIPSDTHLQFFDASGRLVKTFTSLPDNIDLTGLSSGIIIYKLLSASNEVLQTGKLVLQ